MSKRNTVTKQVQLNSATVDRFHEIYGGITNNASLSWVLDLLLEKFVEAHTHTPAELASIGAAELKRLLQDNGS